MDNDVAGREICVGPDEFKSPAAESVVCSAKSVGEGPESTDCADVVRVSVS